MANTLSTVTFSEFQSQIEREFLQGSAVAPALFSSAIQFIEDTEILPGGEVAYPIHEALGWVRIVRFGKQARENEFAALFKNEDGSDWQAKLSHGIQRGKKSYGAPKGYGSRAFLPAVPAAIRQKIEQRYSTIIPSEGAFWEFVETHPEIPIVFTEGGKKSLSLLSEGVIAISLYGVNAGYRVKDELGNPVSPYLIPDVLRFCQPGRTIHLAFDQDESQKTRRRVNSALRRFGGLLHEAGAQVSILSWDGRLGKGIDDLIANQGFAAFERAYSEALLLSHWRIWQRLEGNLTDRADLKINTQDLSTLECAALPERGIIGISSAKGTGKTKFTAQQVGDSNKVLAAGHRIALMRNLSARLGLDYLGDVDKANGAFINGSAYTLRLGFCVDSLLSIDPNKFADCDLILDEVVQVVRHILTSSTCAKEGKRPALLARLRELIRLARRVIVADADLDNATLVYLRELRGDEQPVFLIRNTHRPQGYPVRFLDTNDRAVAVGECLTAAQTLEPGQQLFITTDSKALTKQLLRLLAHECPEKRVLLINSDTSGGEQEREFIQTPDQVIERGDFDLYICSPSVATGVSIEAQGRIATVYGIFSGVSSTDADVAQALGRVREPVPRVVWCAKRGNNYSKVSRAIHPREFRRHLQQQVSATASLIRSSLREDMAGEISNYDWNADPHLRLYCEIAARQNQSMNEFRDSVLVRLKFEGNLVTVEQRAANPVMKTLLLTIRHEQLGADAKARLQAEDLTYAEVLALEKKEGLEPEEKLAVEKFYLKDFYVLDDLTLENILWDQEGRRRGEILNLEAQLYPNLALDRSVKSLEKQATWNKGHCPWDIAHTEVRRWIRESLGLTELIHRILAGWTWTKYDLKPYADKAREMAPRVQIALNFTISPSMSDTQIVHQMLDQLGIKRAKPTWSRSVEGHEGEKLRVHRLDSEHWQQLKGVLDRRQARRQTLSSTSGEIGSPSAVNTIQGAGDPVELPEALAMLGQPETVIQIDSGWFTPESLRDVQETVEGLKDEPVVLAQYLQFVPQAVLEHLGLAS
mgnify:CR=1 FL=1